MTKKYNVIGVYCLGDESVKLLDVPSGSGFRGSARFTPNGGGQAEIGIVIDGKDWEDTLGSLMHESIEFRMHRTGCAYQGAGIPRITSESYMFVMTHRQFDEQVEFASRFIASCLEDVKKIHDKREKKIKQKQEGGEK